MENGQEPNITVRVVTESTSKGSKKKRAKAGTVSFYSDMLRLINFLSPPGVNDHLAPDVKWVVKEAQAKSVSPDLVWLAIFLNSKESNWVADEEAKQIELLSWSFRLTKKDDERLMRLRNELIEDLVPLIEPDEFTRPRDQLTKLLQKVNTMGLQTRWHLEWAVASWKAIAGSKLIARGQRHSPLGPGRGVLKIGNEKLTVRHAFEDRYARELVKREGLVEALRKCLYLTVVSALEDGTFLRLRRCQECQRFFIAGRLGKKYCTDKCMLTADNKQASQTRVPNFRARERAGIKKR